MTCEEGDLHGRTSYRTLADYNADMATLAKQRPNIVKQFELPHTTLEGKTVRGIEIGRDVHTAEDGRPVFAIMGLHHAREWPSGELTMEFAYDLVTNYGTSERITNLLDKVRVLVIPVTNPDGFQKSINDGLLLDLREVDDGGTVSILGTPGNTYKRKNCRMIDGHRPLAGECALASSNGDFGVGIDADLGVVHFGHDRDDDAGRRRRQVPLARQPFDPPLRHGPAVRGARGGADALEDVHRRPVVPGRPAFDVVRRARTTTA
ncbi:MAG: hypothetical protein GEV04_08740 [Actinophytocola sp.]|nr:hypothetical protein [Actinophytocola sp.]